MNWRRASLILRIFIAVAVGIFLIRFAGATPLRYHT